MDGPGFHVEVGTLESASAGIEESVAGSIDKEAFDGPLAIFSADAARTRRGAAGFTTRSPVA